MPIKSPGSNNILSLGTTAGSNSSISGEHGGSAPHSLSEYYQIAGGGKTHSYNTTVPSSGEIRFSNFLGTMQGTATQSASGGTIASTWSSVNANNGSGGTAAAGSRVNITFEYDNNRIKFEFQDYVTTTVNGATTTVNKDLSGGLAQASATTKDARYITAVRYRWVFHDMDVLHFSNNGSGVKVTYVLGHDTAPYCTASNNSYTTGISAGAKANYSTDYRTLNFPGGITSNKAFSTGIECRANESSSYGGYTIATSTVQPRANSVASGGYLQLQLQVYSEGAWQTATLFTTNGTSVGDGGIQIIKAQSSKSPSNNT